MFAGRGIHDITNVADIKFYDIYVNIVHLGKDGSDTQLTLVLRVVLVEHIAYHCYLISSIPKCNCFRLWVG